MSVRLALGSILQRALQRAQPWPLLRPVQLVLLAQLLVQPLASAREPAPPEPFGRWQPKTSDCRTIPAALEPSPCTAVRVDQRSAAVFRVSWPGRAASSGAFQLLTFAGTLAAGSEPMLCRQASCQLRKPIQLDLSSVAESAFDPRGLASRLPSAWTVSGSCVLDAVRIQCEATALSGERWHATASLR